MVIALLVSLEPLAARTDGVAWCPLYKAGAIAALAMLAMIPIHGVSYSLYCIAGLLIAIVMVRSNLFGRTTAYLYLAANLLMVIPSSAGTVGMWCAMLSLLPLAIWLVLIARRLLALGRGQAASPTGHPRAVWSAATAA